MKFVLPALLLAVCSASAQQMAITFDDLPIHGDKPGAMTRLDIAQSILDTIQREKLPPVYGFVNALKIQTEPETESVLKAWRDAGQPLGNHTWSHINLDQIAPEQFEADIVKNEPMLEKYMASADWHWLRYPYLDEGNTVAKRREVRAWLAAHHYQIAEVSMDFEDYLWNDPFARCSAKGDTAAIQKLHDSYLATADQYLTFFRTLSKTIYGRDVKYILLLHVGAFDARMFPELLALYRSRGISFVSLPEATQDPIYAEDPDVGVKGGGAIQELMMAKRKLPFPLNGKPYKELEAACR